jgi:hypothetical protein
VGRPGYRGDPGHHDRGGPISGIARVVQAAPDIALQLGDDLDAAFEELD